MTIFLGANDACIMGQEPYVPWPRFSSNIRGFIDTIFKQETMAATKIILITPPPIGIPAPTLDHPLSPEEIADTNEWKQQKPWYKTYMSKKQYAEGIMEMAREYEGTGRVAGLNFWDALCRAVVPRSKGRGWRGGG